MNVCDKVLVQDSQCTIVYHIEVLVSVDKDRSLSSEVVSGEVIHVDVISKLSGKAQLLPTGTAFYLVSNLGVCIRAFKLVQAPLSHSNSTCGLLLNSLSWTIDCDRF